MKPAQRSRMDRTKAVAYLRVSTAEQHLGTEAQLAAIQRFAVQERLTIVSWHTDKGVSGITPVDQRPGLVAAFQALQEHRIGVLVASRRDRLARDVVVAATIQRLCTSYGVQLATCDGVAQEDTPEGQFQRTLIDAMAQYERALIGSRTRAALQAKKARGELAGGVPFGWQCGIDRRLVPHEGEQAVIVLVRELTEQGMSLARIAQRLESHGYTPRGKRWYRTTIARIQKDGVLHGEQETSA